MWAFKDFYIKPQLLINMYKSRIKNNRAHLQTLQPDGLL